MGRIANETALTRNSLIELLQQVVEGVDQWVQFSGQAVQRQRREIEAGPTMHGRAKGAHRLERAKGDDPHGDSHYHEQDSGLDYLLRCFVTEVSIHDALQVAYLDRHPPCAVRRRVDPPLLSFNMGR